MNCYLITLRDGANELKKEVYAPNIREAMLKAESRWPKLQIVAVSDHERINHPFNNLTLT